MDGRVVRAVVWHQGLSRATLSCSGCRWLGSDSLEILGCAVKLPSQSPGWYHPGSADAAVGERINPFLCSFQKTGKRFVFPHSAASAREKEQGILHRESWRGRNSFRQAVGRQRRHQTNCQGDTAQWKTQCQQFSVLGYSRGGNKKSLHPNIPELRQKSSCVTELLFLPSVASHFQSFFCRGVGYNDEQNTFLVQKRRGWQSRSQVFTCRSTDLPDLPGTLLLCPYNRKNRQGEPKGLPGRFSQPCQWALADTSERT